MKKSRLASKQLQTVLQKHSWDMHNWKRFKKLTKRWWNVSKCCWNHIFICIRYVCTYLHKKTACLKYVSQMVVKLINWRSWHNYFFSFFPTLLLLCYWPHHSCPSLYFWKKLNFLSYWWSMNCRIGDIGNAGVCCQCSDSINYIISFLNLSVPQYLSTTLSRRKKHNE